MSAFVPMSSVLPVRQEVSSHWMTWKTMKSMTRNRWLFICQMETTQCMGPAHHLVVLSSSISLASSMVSNGLLYYTICVLT